MQKHHALVYVATDIHVSSLPDSLRVQSADVQHIVVPRFSIDDARALIQQAQQTAVAADGRTFVIVAQAIPVEAQNALLKLFEEPPSGVVFHLVIPHDGLLIPTLRSRVQLVESHAEVAKNEQFEHFLSSDYAQRLKSIADMAKNKDVVAMTAIVAGAELHLAQNLPSGKLDASAVLLVQEYFQTPGASKKMLLEELALSLPIG